MRGQKQEDVQASVILLRERGPALGRPHVDLVTSSAYPNMKELRAQHNGKPYRTLFAFDPRRIAILLIGGDKTGNDRAGTWSSCRVLTRFMPSTCVRLEKRDAKEVLGTGRIGCQEIFVSWKQRCRRSQGPAMKRKPKKMLAEMPLDELLKLRAMTQVHLAKILGVNQAAVSKMERRTDMYVSTLQDFVKAMGGELTITARFPEGVLEISQFEAVKEGCWRRIAPPIAQDGKALCTRQPRYKINERGGSHGTRSRRSFRNSWKRRSPFRRKIAGVLIHRLVVASTR